jgi:hypothetical protein
MSGTDYTQTPNLGLLKPVFNAAVSNWGQYLNSNADTLDGALLASTATATFVPLAQKGVVNGVASLDGTGLVPVAQLPVLTGTLIYSGAWNAATNTPLLASGGMVGGARAQGGTYYLCSVANAAISPAIDGITAASAGDWMVSNGAVWQRSQVSGTPYLPLRGVTLPKSTGTPADLATKGIVSGDLYNNGGVVCVAP